MRLSWALAAVVSMLPSLALAQAPSIIGNVDFIEVSVGDRVTLSVSVEHAAGELVGWNDTLNVVGGFEVLSANGPVEATLESGRILSGFAFTLAAFELGELVIDPVLFTVVGEDGILDSLSTNPITVSVTSVGLDEEGQIRDIKPPLEIPRNLWLLMPWILLAVVLSGLGYWGYRKYRARPGQVVELVVPAGQILPAHQIALKALATLEASGMIERGEIKMFHVEASEVLRIYVDNRYGVDAMDRTSGEVVAELRAVGVIDAVVADFEVLFRRCDLVKFAKHRPGPDDCKEIVPLARRIVESTREPDSVGEASVAEVRSA